MFNIALLAVLPFLAFFSLEVIYREGVLNTLEWIQTYPDQFIVTYAILFGLINIFYILPRRLYLSVGFLLIGLFSLAGLVSHKKLLLRGEPLLPWDLLLGKEALYITQSFSKSSSPDLAVFLIILVTAIVLLAVFLLIGKEKYRPLPKISTAVLSCLLFISLTHYIPLEKTFNFQLTTWSQKTTYDENGTLLGFLLNVNYMTVKEPEDYQDRNVKDIVSQTDRPYRTDPDFQPNVILVMSEAFWDPTLLTGVTYSEDPLPYFHSLQKKYTSGFMLSPVYGGGTANTEFEVLTGLSTQFLPQGIIPYVQFVHKPLEALPAIYARQGYEATAIHTYDNWFYRRNLVYQDLGFDRFISKEFFNNPEIAVSGYIRDTELSNKILSQIKQSAKPDFIFAVSMEAHGPYPNELYPENHIQVESALQPETEAILANYTNIVADVDQSLKILIEGLKKIDEPSIVVFFGDHLPMLGSQFDVYREAGYFQDENSYEEYLNKYSVPFVVWDNYSRTKEDLRLSANFLGAYILERSKKEGSLLTNFLANLNEKGANVITSSYYLNEEKITDEELAKYRLLQYDVLIGNEYAYQLKPLQKPTARPEYTLGEAPATIVEVLVPDQQTIEVLGGNFSENHQIYVNGQPIETNFVNDCMLTATLSGEYLAKNRILQVQVKMTDSMKQVISESNVYYSGQQS